MSQMKGELPADAGFYHEIFSKRTVRHSRRLRAHHELRDIADAKHAILHTPDGRALLRDTGEDIDTWRSISSKRARRRASATPPRPTNARYQQ